ncbi:MAG: KH domain-containing protein [Microgenomates group bacterium]
MQDILSFILKNITTVPEDVKIEVQDEEGTSNYIVTVNPADVGRIIGKEGKVIKAIRTIMRVIAIQRGVHIRISVVSENDAPVGVDPRVDPSLSTEQPQPVAEDDGSITVEV